MSLITTSVHQCKRVYELLGNDAASMKSSSADAYCTKHFERGSGQVSELPRHYWLQTNTISFDAFYVSTRATGISKAIWWTAGSSDELAIL